MQAWILFLTIHTMPQTGPITARDIEELVLRLHEIQVRYIGGLIYAVALAQRVGCLLHILAA